MSCLLSWIQFQLHMIQYNSVRVRPGMQLLCNIWVILTVIQYLIAHYSLHRQRTATVTSSLCMLNIYIYLCDIIDSNDSSVWHWFVALVRATSHSCVCGAPSPGSLSPKSCCFNQSCFAARWILRHVKCAAARISLQFPPSVRYR
jgi:hypothetical protein